MAMAQVREGVCVGISIIFRVAVTDWCKWTAVTMPRRSIVMGVPGGCISRPWRTVVMGRKSTIFIVGHLPNLPRTVEAL